MKNIIIYLITSIMISFSFGNTIISMNGNMNQFLSMNSGSFIESNYQKINKRTHSLYSMSFTQYPADINFHEVFFQKPISNYIISSKISILNYGTLEDVLNHQFSANSHMLQISIFNIKSSSFTYGLSTGYCQSKIDNYSHALLFYSFGLNKSYLNQKLTIGIALENYNSIIKEYSNLSDSIPSVLKITSSYDFQFIPLNMKINYIHDSDNLQELGIGLIGAIDDKFYLYTGKYFYLDNMNLYSELDNIAFGLGILINNKYKIDFGLQHLNTSIFNIGTSLTVITSDNI
tara:strand:- start:3356 stop:4222 length:867 start_codon:yes stop_codon:yes gene_type:complete